MHNGLKKYLGWKQVGGVVVLTVFIIVLLVRIFSGSGKAADFTESGTAGPEQVLSEFYTSLISGDTDGAMMYCDSTAAVMEYIRDFETNAARLLEEEKGALSIISDMVKVEVSGMKKSGKTVLSLEYSLILDEGKGQESSAEKHRTAEMRLEEGQWKITGITAR